MTTTSTHHRVAIVGAGFGGIGLSIELARAGVDHVVFEAAADLGGTWRDNTYPGCRCDVPSHLYSYSFAPNPDWSETYSPQPEIRAYLERVADEHGVVDRTLFDHRVLAAEWDDTDQVWRIETSQGAHTAEVLVAAQGPLSAPNVPDIDGIDAFDGEIFHSARWDDGVELAGKLVGVVGTGASAVQIVPNIVDEVGELTVFQRTAAWVLPHRNRRITRAERFLYRRFPVLQKLVRSLVYWVRELTCRAMLAGPEKTKFITKLGLRHLHAQVEDPELRRKLTPDFAAGCKRLMPSDDFYPALTRDHVTLVDQAITALDATGAVAADGSHHDLDVLIFATGFHVTTHPMMEVVRGRHGRSLAQQWRDEGMGAYKGTTVPDFPNLFLLAGPNTGIAHTSLIVMLEAQYAYVVDAVRRLTQPGIAAVEIDRDVYEAWDREIQAKCEGTIWNAGGCSSWYLDDRGRNATLWPDQTYRFVALTERFDIERYRITAPAAVPAAEPVPVGA